MTLAMMGVCILVRRADPAPIATPTTPTTPTTPATLVKLARAMVMISRNQSPISQIGLLLFLPLQ